MKVLFCIRPDFKSKIAGDSVQMMTIFKYLSMMGVEVYINDGSIIDYYDYDIIHLFNLTRISETYRYLKIAKKCQKPVVLTPIYWDLKKYYSYSGNDIFLKSWELNSRFRKEIVNECNMLYPSSSIEQQLLFQEFSTDIPCTIVYNCIDTTLFNNQQLKNNADNSFIFCASRICPRKNQLALAYACRELGEDLLLTGDVNNREYLDKCLQFKNVRYLGFFKERDLVRFYKSAKLHVLCSFVETPGLSSLEAGACGCNIVSTSEGSAEEYFQGLATYCDPYNDADIYEAVKKALKLNNQPALQNHILKNYNPEKCLKPLYDSYMDILSVR
jgi:glycosyltransferase involved in cell wall biosynthesis